MRSGKSRKQGQKRSFGGKAKNSKRDFISARQHNQKRAIPSKTNTTTRKETKQGRRSSIDTGIISKGLSYLSLSGCNAPSGCLSTIKFVADSGASEHMIKSKFLLSNFQRSGGDYIRCANKQRSVNLHLHSRGDFYLISHDSFQRPLKLTNVC